MKKLIIILILVTAVYYFFFSRFGIAESAKWVNWGRNQECNPKQIFYPENKQELINIIKKADKNNFKIRAYSSSHAWSPIVCTDYLINTEKINNIISVDKENNLVQVEAGIKIYDLNLKLADMGLALPNQSFTQAQALAGDIATATHGTGHTGTFSDFIKDINIILADGSEKNISLEKEPKYFKAASTNVGSLGIIYAVTLKCESLFKVKHKREQTDFKTVSSIYKQLNQKHDFFQFFWNPYTDSVITYIWDKVDPKSEITSFSNTILTIKNKMLIGHWTGEFWVRFLDLFPALYPKFIDMLYYMSQTDNHIAYPHEIMTAAKKSNQEVIYEEEEIAVPIDSLIQAAHDLKILLEKYRKYNFYPLFWGILFRFTKPDKNSYISMSSGKEGDDKVYISFTSAHINQDFYKEFEDIMMKYNGRPHWGKINFLDYKKAKKLYGKNLDKFIDIRKELDPKGLFINKYIESVFTKNS